MTTIAKKRANPRKQKQAKANTTRIVAKAVAFPGGPHAVVELRRRMRLSQPLFARLLPMSVRSLATLEGGKAATEVVARRLTELRRLTDALAEVMNEDSLGDWIQTPNEVFDGLKPLEVIDRGETDRIWAMIYFVRSGNPS